ncbi:SNF8 isoform 10 [Pan troglodytes]|uniref:SNF8 subunit of ESCRT-II n=11 Tax=Catarrhini TaxID=9526 RepID=I3L2X5_HUMAN|nr:SNF8 subunit of ESCRT-II [Homo sapiens]KAI4050324.1 SNF8 subunit of ESCRT-II [Homo sapiens]PNI36744.1 SNF8 isoform 10 [Pan troglodytes]PNJ66274.1 SNF8 isoform 3 [Pongo abelii]
MHRRGVGAGAIAKKKLAEAKYKERGTVLAEDQLAQLEKDFGLRCWAWGTSITN